MNYPNLQSAQRPIPQSDDLPLPQPPVNKDDVIDEENVSENSDSMKSWSITSYQLTRIYVAQDTLLTLSFGFFSSRFGSC